MSIKKPTKQMVTEISQSLYLNRYLLTLPLALTFMLILISGSYATHLKDEIPEAMADLKTITVDDIVSSPTHYMAQLIESETITPQSLERLNHLNESIHEYVNLIKRLSNSQSLLSNDHTSNDQHNSLYQSRSEGIIAKSAYITDLESYYQIRYQWLTEQRSLYKKVVNRLSSKQHQTEKRRINHGTNSNGRWSNYTQGSDNRSRNSYRNAKHIQQLKQSIHNHPNHYSNHQTKNSKEKLTVAWRSLDRIDEELYTIQQEQVMLLYMAKLLELDSRQPYQKGFAAPNNRDTQTKLSTNSHQSLINQSMKNESLKNQSSKNQSIKPSEVLHLFIH